MAKEVEAKYALPDEGALAAVLADGSLSPFLVPLPETRMEACYFDTADGLLQSRRAGLRLRREGEISVACLKLSEEEGHGLFCRAEYECPAQTMEEGLFGLEKAGAPAGLLAALRERGLVSLCRTAFDRRRWLYEKGGLAAELAADKGEITGPSGRLPLFELEVELKSGDEEAFAALAAALAARHGLAPERQSKLARGLSLSRQPKG